MATLKLERLNLVYGGNGNPSTHAVRDVDLVVGDGEFCVFLGPSGCGKTSTLRMIAGLETPTSGVIRLDGRVINDLYPGERDIAMVFQSYALYPHLTVRGHLELPLRAQRAPKAERERRVNEIADLLQIADLLEARPRQLSGGQAQRTAIGRALIRQPRLFLLDEPLTNLDARLRLETRAALKRLQNELGITTIYVTHDQEEALSLADTIVVMNEGCVQQVATSRELYSHPINRFVAGFIGTPPMNFLAATIQPSANGHVDESPLTVVTAVFRLPLSARVMSSGVHDRSRLVPGAALTLGVRPEDLIVGSPAGEDGPRGRVVVVEPQGDERIISVVLTGGDAAGTVWKVRAPKQGPSANIAVGDAVGLTVRPRGLRLFDEQTEERVL
ncbi:MAG TPA: ABC transporter ATP-binding protein [Thermomicrobiales bacterium]|nr:ABC transporter ATP-binding protein [Thermomicrobiales bacterium]